MATSLKLSKRAESAAITLMAALDYGIDRCIQEEIDRDSLSEALLEVAFRIRRIGRTAVEDRPRSMTFNVVHPCEQQLMLFPWSGHERV